MTLNWHVQHVHRSDQKGQVKESRLWPGQTIDSPKKVIVIEKEIWILLEKSGEVNIKQKDQICQLSCVEHVVDLCRFLDSRRFLVIVNEDGQAIKVGN